MYWLDNVSSSLLHADMNGLWARQQAISDNMANFETPGYKQKDVSFAGQLRAEMANAGQLPTKTINRIENVSPLLTQEENEKYRADGNGVDLEQSMIDMFRTTTNYSYSIQMNDDYFNRLRAAITGAAK